MQDLAEVLVLGELGAENALVPTINNVAVKETTTTAATETTRRPIFAGNAIPGAQVVGRNDANKPEMVERD